jgi:hypothetical protein
MYQIEAVDGQQILNIILFLICSKIPKQLKEELSRQSVAPNQKPSVGSK